MKNMKQTGFTLIEMIFAIFGLASLIGAGFGVYAIVHFVTKYW
ncbi:hypothetical protein AHP1_3091 [Aeromonas phage Ahp1_CNU-2021]|nr:hypothetical protein AHP1_3091 [Aeromonas phage Ahp1_CNU-2021]